MRDQNVSCMEISGFKYVSVFASDKTPEELRETLLSKIKLVLSSGSDEECTVCLESPTHPVITHCAHVFCKTYTFEVLRIEQLGIPLQKTSFDRCRMLDQRHNAVITKDLVEENILKIQNKKRELAAGAFATKKPSASNINEKIFIEMKALD